MEKYDYSKLRGKIREIFHTERAFSNALGLSKASLSAKLNGHVEFTQSEIIKAALILYIPKESIADYFFRK